MIRRGISEIEGTQFSVNLSSVRDFDDGALCTEINFDTIVEGVRTVAVGADRTLVSAA